jgi:multicomponent Na+:H+ antiporter subunit F
VNEGLLLLAAFLALNVAAGLVRVARGPSPADRMLVAQLFGTTGVAILLVLAEAMEAPELRTVALVFALLAVVISVAFVKRGWVRPVGEVGEVGEESGEGR